LPRIDRRFTVLFSEEEILLLKKQAKIRGISSGELIRIAVQNEIYGKSFSDKLTALRKLYNLGKNSVDLLQSEEHPPTSKKS